MLNLHIFNLLKRNRKNSIKTLYGTEIGHWRVVGIKLVVSRRNNLLMELFSVNIVPFWVISIRT